jgi:CRISPR-associated endonuclease Csy4
MTHFVDIIVNGNQAQKTLAKLMISVHFFLTKNPDKEVIVDFPKIKMGDRPRMGKIIRLYADEETLSTMVNGRLFRRSLVDTTFSPIELVSKFVVSGKYIKLRRRQVKNNPQRLYRRSVKNGFLTQAEANAKIADWKMSPVKVPFLTLLSQSTKNVFKYYLDREIVSEECGGTYNAYGVSQDATFPLINYP